MSSPKPEKTAKFIKAGRQLTPIVMVPSKREQDCFDVLVRLPTTGLFVFAEARSADELQLESMEGAMLFKHGIRINFRYARVEDLEKKNPQHGMSVYLAAGEGKRQRRIIVPLTMENITTTLNKAGFAVRESTSTDGRRVLQADVPTRPNVVQQLRAPTQQNNKG